MPGVVTVVVVVVTGHGVPHVTGHFARILSPYCSVDLHNDFKSEQSNDVFVFVFISPVEAESLHSL